MCDFHLLDPNNFAWVQNNYSSHSFHPSNSSQALAPGSAAPTPANKRQYQVLTSTSTKIPISLTTDTSIIETPAPQTPAQAKPKPRTPAIVKFAIDAPLFAGHDIIPDIEEFQKGPWRLKERVKAVEVVKVGSCIRIPTYTATAAAAAADAPQSRTTATVTDRPIFETTPLSTDGPTKLTFYSKFGWQAKEKNLLQLHNDAHNEVPSFADAEADSDADAGAGADAGADANQARSAQAAGSDEAALAASPTQSTTPAAVAAKEKKKKKKKEKKGKAAQRMEGEREEVSEGVGRVELKIRRFGRLFNLNN